MFDDFAVHPSRVAPGAPKPKPKPQPRVPDRRDVANLETAIWVMAEGAIWVGDLGEMHQTG